MIRSRCGSSIVELSISCVGLTAVTVVMLNIIIVIFSFFQHDRYCQLAARAASFAQSKEEAIAIARETLKQISSASPYLSTPSFSDADLSFEVASDEKLRSKSKLTLVTRAIIKYPAPVVLGGIINTMNEGIESRASYTLPLTKVKLAIPGELQ